MRTSPCLVQGLIWLSSDHTAPKFIVWGNTLQFSFSCLLIVDPPTRTEGSFLIYFCVIFFLCWYHFFFLSFVCSLFVCFFFFSFCCIFSFLFILSNGSFLSENISFIIFFRSVPLQFCTSTASLNIPKKCRKKTSCHALAENLLMIENNLQNHFCFCPFICHQIHFYKVGSLSDPMVV